MYLVDTSIGVPWMTVKLGDSGGFLPGKSPQEPTLRTQSHSLYFRVWAEGKAEAVLEATVEVGVGGGEEKEKSPAWGLAKYLKMVYQLLRSDFDDDVILRKSPL